MSRLIFLLATLFLIGCSSPKETSEESFSQLVKLIDQYAEATIKRGNINSLAISIYKDGFTYKQYYGELDESMNNTPNDSTLYEIASISKVFTGSLMAKAILEERISLDDDIRLYLKGNYSNLELNGAPVRIRDLVTHTLGFSMPERMEDVYNKIFDGYYEDKEINYDIDDLLGDLESVRLERAPGKYYDYSNVGPELAAYILEQVYEKPYSELLKEFLQKLNITDIHINNVDKDKLLLANGYDSNNNIATVIKNPLFSAAGGLVATLPGLTKFMKFHLEDGNPLIKESTKYLFKNGEDDTGYYWDLGRAKKEGFYYIKSGSSNGIESLILICPDSNYGIVMVMNNQSDDATVDWINLYNRIEYDIIEYPKINLWSTLEAEFITDPRIASEKYEELRTKEDKYFSSSTYLNRVGYSYIASGELEKAINILRFAISFDTENSNLYDSLGEVYYLSEDFKESRKNYSKSIALDPDNMNAANYLSKIDEILKDN